MKDRKLKSIFEQAVLAILEQPYSGQVKAGDLRGFWGYDIKYQGTNFEIAYAIIEDEASDPIAVVFVMAGTRENFWDVFKKYSN